MITFETPQAKLVLRYLQLLFTPSVMSNCFARCLLVMILRVKSFVVVWQMQTSKDFSGNVCSVHTISVFYPARLCMKCSFGISDFLEEIPSHSHSVVFLYFFALIAEEGFLIYLCYSLELCIQMFIFPFLLCFSLLFFSQLFVRPPQTAILLFCISFPWLWSWSLSPVQCHEPHSIAHQTLYLSDLGP